MPASCVACGQKKTASKWRFRKNAALGEPHFVSGEELLRLRLLEHTIQSLIRRVAAGLSRLRRLQSLIRGALSARRSLLCLRCRALCSIRRILRSFSSCTDGIELFRGRSVCATGHHRKAADERRCPQSSLDFCGH
jgi:hypothetical protein